MSETAQSESQDSSQLDQKASPILPEKIRQFSTPILIVALLGATLFVSILITFSIEQMRTTVGKQKTHDPSPDVAARHLTEQNIETATFNKNAPSISQRLEEQPPATNPNTETATFNNVPSMPRRLEEPPTTNPNTETATFNKTSPVTGSRIETALFEKPAKTLEQIKQTPPEQLELKIQVHYTDTQWANLTQTVLQLESGWQNNVRVFTQKFAAQLQPNTLMTLSTQTLAVPAQNTQQRDISWTQVLDQMWELETLRASMTDIFIQQLYPQTVNLNRLSNQLNHATQDTVTWQQVMNQILIMEEYRADMLKTVENTL